MPLGGSTSRNGAWQRPFSASGGAPGRSGAHWLGRDPPLSETLEAKASGRPSSAPPRRDPRRRDLLACRRRGPRSASARGRSEPLSSAGIGATGRAALGAGRRPSAHSSRPAVPTNLQKTLYRHAKGFERSTKSRSCRQGLAFRRTLAVPRFIQKVLPARCCPGCCSIPDSNHEKPCWETLRSCGGVFRGYHVFGQASRGRPRDPRVERAVSNAALALLAEGARRR